MLCHGDKRCKREINGFRAEGFTLAMPSRGNEEESEVKTSNLPSLLADGLRTTRLPRCFFLFFLKNVFQSGEARRLFFPNLSESIIVTLHG